MNKIVHYLSLDVHKETIAKDGGALPRRRYGGRTPVPPGESGTSNIELLNR